MKPSFDVSSNEVLSILFPEEFGLELGLNISCTVEGLEGQAYCSLSKARIIDVKDFRDFDACDSCYVTIRISGIINPNHNNGKSTGSFKLGFRTESHFTQYNENVGKVSFLPAPKLATLNSFTASNFYSRRDNQFSITFTSS